MAEKSLYDQFTTDDGTGIRWDNITLASVVILLLSVLGGIADVVYSIFEGLWIAPANTAAGNLSEAANILFSGIAKNGSAAWNELNTFIVEFGILGYAMVIAVVIGVALLTSSILGGDE